MAGPAGPIVTGREEIRVLRADRDGVRLPGAGDVRAIVWPGMGARHRSLHYIRLGAGESTDRWRHPGEAVYYVLRGSGWFEDGETGEHHPVREGLIVHVGAGTPYRMVAEGGLTCVGGPCPPDPHLYRGVPLPGQKGGDRP